MALQNDLYLTLVPLPSKIQRSANQQFEK